MEGNKELVNTVAQFLAQPGEARTQALQIILQLSTDKDSRNLFLEQGQILKLLLRIFPEKEHTADTLKCFINLSESKEVSLELVKLNAIGRFFEYLKEHLKQDMPGESGQTTYLDQDANSFILNKEVGVVSLIFMLLSNLTREEEGQKGVMLHENEELKGWVLHNFIEMFLYFRKNEQFDFISNSIANVTGLKEAREYVIDKGLYVRLLDELLSSPNGHRREYLLQAIRNCIFAYETHLQKIIESDTIGKLINFLKEITEISEAKLPRKETIIENTLDTFILLCNSEEALKLLHDVGIKGVLESCNFQQEELQTKVMVVTNQIQTIDEGGKQQDIDENHEWRKD